MLMDILEYEKKGYLDYPFRLFHLTGQEETNVDYHYHEFDKIILFLSGKVHYLVEGKSYLLEPLDLVVIPHHEIHRPDVDRLVSYERIILYISPDFLREQMAGAEGLDYCFQYAKRIHNHIFRLHPEKRDLVPRLFLELETALNEKNFGAELYSRNLFLNLMIMLARCILDQQLDFSGSIIYDEKIIEIVHYINANLDHSLSVDEISDTFYISKYHLMRKFKKETGYTLHNYINRKRLLHAKELLQQGQPVTKVCYDCGFGDYSAFLKAFKSMFHISPKEIRKAGRLP